MKLNSVQGRQYLHFIFSLPTLLVAIWVLTLRWGERSVFKASLEDCRWDKWERWSPSTVPHHVVLIADPQLVDPHTYPDRPWPLSSITVWATDLYLRRSYRLLQEYLDPDTIFFLGDLFDGGREWATATSSSPEQRYKKYGDKFWQKEYRRFVNMFLRGWKQGYSGYPAEARGRKLISSLPGNHDLGFAGGIQLPVRGRFDAYFGPLNRVEIVGNHTFISLDTVSLSAMDQIDPATGSSGLGDGTAAATPNSLIWKPVDEFLQQAKSYKEHAVQKEVLQIAGAAESVYLQSGGISFLPSIAPLSSAPLVHKKQTLVPTSRYPSIILSHVPLFRPPDTDCGPSRERGRALSISAGYQYQNVLTPLISKDIVTRLDAAEITQIYSGDDHDYCEIEHLEFTGRIKEITVKSMSWAMGVRRPGFQAVSLYNPVDLTVGDGSMPKDTVQNRLCLLPDQLAIFIRYAQLLCVTLLALGVRAILHKSDPVNSAKYGNDNPLLPFFKDKTPHTSSDQHFPSSTSHTSSTSHHTSVSSQVSTRSNGRPASPSKLGGYGNLPPSSRSASPAKHVGEDDFFQPPKGRSYSVSDDWSTAPKRRKDEAGRGKWTAKAYEFRRSTAHVALPVLLYYCWLVWDV